MTDNSQSTSLDSDDKLELLVDLGMDLTKERNGLLLDHNDLENYNKTLKESKDSLPKPKFDSQSVIMPLQTNTLAPPISYNNMNNIKGNSYCP